MSDIKKFDEDEFVKIYKLAHKLKWSRENLAEFTGLVTDSIRRRVGKIKDKTGILLQPLPLTFEPLTSDMIQAMKDEFNKLAVKENGMERTGRGVYLITSAQNATPIHKGFYDSCMSFCEENGAEFIVIPFRYKNPTSLWNDNNKKEEWWADHLVPHLVDYKLRLAPRLMVLGDMKSQPTGAEPIARLDAVSGQDTTIVGSPKVQMKSVPTSDATPKQVMSTGTITKPNYTDSKIGYTAEFHHSIAGIVVEVDDDGAFYTRQIHADNKTGAFYDLDARYSPDGVTYGHAALALVTGDTHAEFIDPEVEDATYHAIDSIVAVCKPAAIIVHDVLDFYRRNHHTRNNDTINYGKHKYGQSNVQDELQNTADFLDRIAKPDQKVIIVKSNHDEAFDKWLREVDPKIDPENADFFHYMKYHQYKSVKRTDTGYSSFDPFAFWCFNPENGKGLQNRNNTKFLARDESYRIAGIEVGFHGDVGINGSRGDAKSLSKLSDKIIIGHSHSPAIYNSAYQVGLSARTNLEYKRGPSTWMHTHCIIYPDGKRSLINIIEGKWKL